MRILWFFTFTNVNNSQKINIQYQLKLLDQNYPKFYLVLLQALMEAVRLICLGKSQNVDEPQLKIEKIVWSVVEADDRLRMSLFRFWKCANGALILLILHANLESFRLTIIVDPDTFCPNTKIKIISCQGTLMR